MTTGEVSPDELVELIVAAMVRTESDSPCSFWEHPCDAKVAYRFGRQSGESVWFCDEHVRKVFRGNLAGRVVEEAARERRGDL